MDNPSTSYLDLLAAHGDALESLIEWLPSGGEAARAHARRLAQSLSASAETFGYPAVQRAATRVSDGDEPRIEALAASLLRAIRKHTGTGAPTPTAVVVAVASEATRRTLQRRLGGPGRTIYAVSCARHVVHLAERERLAMIVLDAALDGAADALFALRTTVGSEHLPVMMMLPKERAGQSGELHALGADGVFCSEDADQMALAIAGQLRRRRRSVQAMVNDPLTGLPNRGALEEAFRQASGRAQRSGAQLALAVLDFDRFKLINDSYGHVMGDEVLRRASQIIRRRLRSSDVLVRWGGEELVALLPDTELEAARTALEHALQQVRQETYDAPGGRRFSATFSAGVVRVTDGESLEEALVRADERLYVAKASGRARVVMSGQKLPQRRLNVLVVEDDLVLGRLIRARLQAVGAQVTQAITVEEARELLASTSYDLVLLDVELPDGNGLTLLVELRSAHRTAATPVLVLTGHADSRTATAAFELGANDYMTKPAPTRELLARIGRLVNLDGCRHDDEPREGRRVLIGDESPRVRSLVGLTLRTSSRWTVTEARSGAEALAAAAMAPFDLVVLDLELTDPDGAATLARLRRLPGHARTPVVLLSEHDDPALRERLSDLEVSGVLAKPCDPIALRRQLEAIAGPAHEETARPAA